MKPSRTAINRSGLVATYQAAATLVYSWPATIEVLQFLSAFAGDSRSGAHPCPRDNLAHADEFVLTFEKELVL